MNPVYARALKQDYDDEKFKPKARKWKQYYMTDSIKPKSDKGSIIVFKNGVTIY